MSLTPVFDIFLEELYKSTIAAQAEKKAAPEPKAPAEEEALPHRYDFISNCNWKRAAEYIDRFRSKVSAYYGFKIDLIQPVCIADPKDPLHGCKFDVLGIRYEVHDAQLTCIGEMQ